MHETSPLPTYHGISGFLPNEMFDDFVSERTLLELNMTKPSTWTTYHSLFRLKAGMSYDFLLLENDLCLSFNSEPKKSENGVIYDEAASR